MLTLPRYLFADTAKPALVACAVMLCLVWLLQSLRFLDFVINKGLGLGTFLELTLLMVPLLLTIILPLSVFAGATYGFKRLQDENELTSLFGTGRGPWWVIAPALLVGVIGVGLSYGLYNVLLPQSTAMFKDLQYEIRNQEGHLLLEEGTFNQVGPTLMVYIKKREDEGHIAGLLVHDTRNPANPVTWMAKEGEVLVDADGYPRIILREGIRQEVNQKQVTMLEFSEHTLDVRKQVKTSAMGPRNRAREEYLLPELWQKAQGTGPEANRLRAEAHKRLLWPLTPLPLVLLAAAFLVRPAGRRRASLHWVGWSITGAILYQSSLIGLQSLADSGHTTALATAWALPFATSVLASVMLQRNRHG